MEQDVTSFLPSIKVHQFPPVYSLSRGRLVSPEDDSIIDCRVAFLECPTCLGIDNFYNLEPSYHYDTSHCPGNQPPEYECCDQLGNKHTHPISCAGISSPHFHIRCKCCDTIFFLSIPEKK